MSEGFASYSDVSVEEFVRKIEAQLSNLPKQEAKVAQYILLNLDSLSFETATPLPTKPGWRKLLLGGCYVGLDAQA